MILRQKRKMFCDVLVVGGGVSGSMAAVSSSRIGLRTLLIEKDKLLGGAGEKALLNNVCGLYLGGGEFPTSTLNGGLAEEVAARLKKMSNQSRIRKVGKVYLLPFSRGSLQRTLDSLCRDEKNLNILLDTTADFAATRNGEILEVTAYSGRESYQIIPKAVIDCTDSGEIAFMAGAEFHKSPNNDERQLAGYSVLIKGIATQDYMLPVKVCYYLNEAVTQKLFPYCFRFTHYSKGETDGEGFLKFSIAEPPGTGRDKRTQKNAERAVEYLKGKILPLKTCRIAESSPSVVERETLRVRGEYTLTEDDVLSARKFADGVVKNSWPIEIWDRKKGPVYKYVKSGDYYEIPARCFKAKNLKNLFCGGRAISVSQTAFGSTRVMGTCMAIGEQAGRLASNI